MKTLKTLALIGASALAISAVSAAAAQAQPWHGYAPARQDNAYGARLSLGYLDRLDGRIANAQRERLISWNEARDLRGELRDARAVARRVQTGRADRWEVRRLDQTVDRIEAATNRLAYNDRDGYRDWRR